VAGAEPAAAVSDRVYALDFSPDGALLAAGSGVPSRAGEIRLWQAVDGKLVGRFDDVHSDTVFGVRFSPDGKLLASSAADRFVRVIDLGQKKVVRSYEGHTHHVLGVAWKRDGRVLASAGADNVIKTWDFVTGERRKNVAGVAKEVSALQFVGVTDQLLAGSGDGRVRFVKEDGSEAKAFAGFTDFVYGVAASADGSVVVAGGQDGVLRVWNGNDAKVIAEFGAGGGK
jgi:WD40 repeat protein